MKNIKYMSVLIICFVISACVNNELDMNQAKWDDSGITSYSYVLETNALPIPVEKTKLEITVIDNKVQTVTVVIVDGFPGLNINGEVLEIMPTLSLHFLSMRPLSISRTFEATYDETYGFPTSYSVKIDLPFTEDVDESIVGQYFIISDFTELPQS